MLRQKHLVILAAFLTYPILLRFWLGSNWCSTGTQALHRLIRVAGYGGLTVAGCQVPTKAALSLPLLNWTGGEKIK